APTRGARCGPGRTFRRGSLWQPLSADLSVPEHHELLRGEALEPDRTPGVQLVGGDADFGAEAVLVAVGEAGRGVPHHRARVALAPEAVGPRGRARRTRARAARARTPPAKIASVCGEPYFAMCSIASSRPLTTRIDTTGAS